MTPLSTSSPTDMAELVTANRAASLTAAGRHPLPP